MFDCSFDLLFETKRRLNIPTPVRLEKRPVHSRKTHVFTFEHRFLVDHHGLAQEQNSLWFRDTLDKREWKLSVAKRCGENRIEQISCYLEVNCSLSFRKGEDKEIVYQLFVLNPNQRHDVFSRGGSITTLQTFDNGQEWGYNEMISKNDLQPFVCTNSHSVVFGVTIYFIDND